MLKKKKKAEILFYKLSDSVYKILDPEFPSTILAASPSGQPHAYISAYQYYLSHILDATSEAQVKKVLSGTDISRIWYYGSAKAGGVHKKLSDIEKQKLLKKAIKLKVIQNPCVATVLLNTENNVLQYQSVDDFLGIGKFGKGQNTVGEILMDLRKQLVNEEIKLKTNLSKSLSRV